MANYILFISEQKLKDSTAIGNSVDIEHLLSSIRTAQKQHIERVLGSDLFNKLQSDIQAGSLTGAYETLVEDYIADTLVHFSFWQAIPFLRHKVQNGNIVSRTSEDATAITRQEAQDLREEVRNTAEFYLERLINFLKHNVSSFPEYNTNTGHETSPDRNAFYSSMNLESGNTSQRGLTLNDIMTPDNT